MFLDDDQVTHVLYPGVIGRVFIFGDKQTTVVLHGQLLTWDTRFMRLHVTDDPGDPGDYASEDFEFLNHLAKIVTGEIVLDLSFEERLPAATLLKAYVR